MRILPAILLSTLVAAVAVLCDDSVRPLSVRLERFGRDKPFTEYIKDLQDFYSVHGRGRFGKRQMHTTHVYTQDLTAHAPAGPRAFRLKKLLKNILRSPQ